MTSYEAIGVPPTPASPSLPKQIPKQRLTPSKAAHRSKVFLLLALAAGVTLFITHLTGNSALPLLRSGFAPQFDFALSKRYFDLSRLVYCDVDSLTPELVGDGMKVRVRHNRWSSSRLHSLALGASLTLPLFH